MTKAEFLAYAKSFNDNKNGFLFFAPGRVNLIGDHTDYTGGFVLPAAIQYGTLVLLKFTAEPFIRFRSENISKVYELPLNSLWNKKNDWVDYPLGVMKQLATRGWQPAGMELTYFGDIPTGAGLSSSASIEMATAYALNRVFDLGLEQKELVLLAQKAENDFVGVRCGIMDQYTVGFGEKNKALMIDCHNVTHQAVPVKFENYRFVAVNSNKKRGLTDSAYNRRVRELETVKHVLNQTFEVPYLGILSVEDAEWLDKLIADEVLLKRLRHVVNENARVKMAAEMLMNGDVNGFGKMMLMSHDSLAHDFEVSCKELDLLVSIAMETEGVAGSRMTGAGFGGCTISLVHKDALPDFKNRILSEYSKATGISPDIYPVEFSGECTQVKI